MAEPEGSIAVSSTLVRTTAKHGSITDASTTEGSIPYYSTPNGGGSISNIGAYYSLVRTYSTLKYASTITRLGSAAV